jgi:hypothetical protein
VIRRAEMLGEIMRLKQGVAVAGTHGKTTTTSLTGMVLTEAGFDPTIVVGGQVHILGTNARLGKGDYLVAEADEYDRSFLQLTPVVAVITNVEADHLDTYRDLDDILDAFATFANRVPFFGAVVACVDDAGVRRLLPRIKKRVVTYGESPEARFRPGTCASKRPRRPSTSGTRRGRLGSVRLRLPGVTTWPTRSRRSPRVASCSSLRDDRRRAGRLHGRGAALRAQGRARACSSWTTTRTTQRKFARRSPRRARSTRSAGSWRSSSPISSHARATSRTTSARRSPRPT